MSKWNHKQAYANHMKKRPKTTMTTTKINPDYFKTPHAHSGIVTHFKNVYGLKTRKDTKSVWRVWVRIRTTEGWTLMGYIGEKDTEAELPKVQRGDPLVLEPLVLSDWNRYDGKDERPADFSRQLKGKIVRGAGASAAAAPTNTGRNPFADQESEMRDSFDCPKVWGLKSPSEDKCIGFIPNVFGGAEHAIDGENKMMFGMATFDLATDEAVPVWRWRGTTWMTKDEAVAKWDELVAEGYADKFDMITDPLNKDNRHPADRYATLFSGQTNTFAALVRSYKCDFPRKKVTA